MLVCDTRARALFSVFECHIIQSLSYDIVLAFD